MYENLIKEWSKGKRKTYVSPNERFLREIWEEYHFENQPHFEYNEIYPNFASESENEFGWAMNENYKQYRISTEWDGWVWDLDNE